MEAQLPQSPASPKSGATNDGEKLDTPNKQLRRACDCCRKRKVRCDGHDPCGPCKKASITCAYLQPPKKKGPKGLRSARVLHALRRIDDRARASPAATISPENAPFSNWSWDNSNPAKAPATEAYSNHTTEAQLHPTIYTQQNSAETGQHISYQQMPTAIPQHQPHISAPSSAYPNDRYAPQDAWMTGAPHSVSTSSDAISPVFPSPNSNLHHGHLLANTAFLPYIQLFFTHMFQIMPIIDRRVYLDPSFYTRSGAMGPEQYSFLCSICAATVVQLDTSIQQPPPIHHTKKSDELFAEECLRERNTYDYIEHSSQLSIMTSFFLFAYYGNHEKHAKAWHYLQESITIAQNLNMDDEVSYEKLDAAEAQWQRRLYWLLFITERAYAVQRRKHTRLHASVALPAIFESEDSQMLNGFVNLANLFSAVDESFVSAWRGSRRASLCDEAWLARTQKQLDNTAHTIGSGELTETQRLDINVTREWLHVLAWQMGVSNGLIWGQGEGGMRLDYPVELARKVVEITSGANALALDSHGIGMEQKLSDIAGCLADVLRCTAGDTSATFSEGKKYLNILLQTLSTIRGKQSRYLQPLMSKMEGVTGYELGNDGSLSMPPHHNPILEHDVINGLNQHHQHQDQQLQQQQQQQHQQHQQQQHQQHAPTGFATAIPRWSMADSVGMLRRLSMTGNLGMPGLALPQEDWTLRRPSGRVLDEQELEALQPWLSIDPAHHPMQGV